MSTELFVANLPYYTTDTEVLEMFKPLGAVTRCRLVLDESTHKSRGCAFVEMGSDADAARAIVVLDSTDFEGRVLKVGQTHPTEAQLRATQAEMHRNRATIRSLLELALGKNRAPY